MKTRWIICLFAFALLTGCGLKTKKNTAGDGETQEVSAPVIVTAKDSVIKLTVIAGEAKATYAKDARERVTFEFESGGYKKVHVGLTSDDPVANIRLSQIIMPDGNADGPWGREMDYNLPVAGLYKLIVTENMMAGEPWAGTFTITIKLSE